MSYTMTLDVPDRTAAYVERRGPRYRAELNAIFVAIVAANMKSDEAEARRDGFEWKAPEGASNGKAVFDAIRACPEDVDFDQLITKRTSCGRAHPVDFAAMRREDA